MAGLRYGEPDLSTEYCGVFIFLVSFLFLPFPPLTLPLAQLEALFFFSIIDCRLSEGRGRVLRGRSGGDGGAERGVDGAKSRSSTASLDLSQ